MTWHLISLIWNRKRHNFLLAVEIFFSFLVLFSVVFTALKFADNWRRPLGFDIDRVWNVNVIRTGPPRGPAAVIATYQQLVAAVRDLPQVESAAAAYAGPYGNSNWRSGDELTDGRETEYELNGVTDDFQRVVSLQLVHGRWFSREDDADALKPVVINRRLALAFFGTEDAAGRIVRVKHVADEISFDPREDKRVIGVVDDFRKGGELSEPDNFLFHRLRLDGGGKTPPVQLLPNVLVLRVAPGTTAAFEEPLVRRLQSASGGWTFDVRPVTEQRHDILRKFAATIVAIAIIAGFLLLMVALGLTGVVWQSVTQRTREFGLRRAHGATMANVRRQVLCELAVLSTLALLAAVLLVVQLPFLPIDLREYYLLARMAIDRGVFSASIALSVAAIYLLTLICGWYPSRLATRIQPAEALHYE
jgi:putative ABC transport system permease protein